MCTLWCVLCNLNYIKFGASAVSGLRGVVTTGSDRSLPTMDIVFPQFGTGTDQLLHYN